MTTYLALFAFNFFGVMCKSFQQISVIKDKWLLIPPVSYMMYLWLVANIYFVSPVVSDLDALSLMVLAGGTGGWLGSWAGMLLHKIAGKEKSSVVITHQEFENHKDDRSKLLISKGVPMARKNNGWVLDENYEIGIEMILDSKSPRNVAYKYTWMPRNVPQD